MKQKIYNLFPSSVHYIDLENFSLVKKRVISYIYKEKEKFPDPLGILIQRTPDKSHSG